ncbi:hypothetical protein ACMH5Q_06725, partial [Aquirufa lenticrescens]
STKGKIQLAGDLGGTAAAPTVPGLALKANEADVITALALKANTTDVTTALALKANTADLTTLTTTVNTNTASITVNTASITANSASIDLKASQSDLTNLTTRVDGNSLSITNLATVARSGSYTDLLNLPTSITASTLSGTVSISKGGTGAVTANAAFNALAPDQASKSGKFLTTDGTSTSWASVASNLPTTVNTSSSYNIVMATDQNSSLVTGTGNGGTTATLNPYTGQMNISGATVGGYGLATSGKLTVGSIAPAVTSAQLEVNSTNKGFLPPRMTLAQRSQIYAPVQGLMIMCTDCSTQGEVQVYTGSYWSNVAGTLPTTTIGSITAPLVGAAYQGGKVAYILTPADPGYDHKKVKGFIIALQDLPSDYPLRSGSVYISTIANSGTAVGDGLVNTNLLVAAYGNTNIHAAKAANDYSITEAGVVYDDWYLPSKDEMKIIYDNRVVLNAGFNANTDKWYWTSSYASNSSGGWRLTFVNGYIGAQGSESSYFVRPIRYFSIDKNIDISASTFTGSLVGNAATATLANTATTAVNITATTNISLTSLPNLATVGSISSGIWSASTIDIAHGGTGSTSQNFVDLSSNQNSIGGSKTFTNNIVANGINIGKGGGGSSTLLGDATSANDNSTAIGFMALNGNSGINNTAMGANTMRNSGSTANTTAVGVIAGQNSNTGNNNTFIGYAASVPDGSSISNSTAIGSGATVTNSNTIQLGADGTNGFTAIESVKTTGTLTTGAVTYPKSHGSNGQVLSTTGNGTLTWTTISSTTNASTLTGTINVVNGGTGATSLTGYLKGNGTNAFTSSNTIPASDVSGLIIKVNGSLPDANGYVTIPFGSVTTGTLGNRPISAGTNGNIYVVSSDATTSDNGRTYISDGSNWNEVTTNQAATDARYFQLAGGTLNGSLTIPTNNILTVTDAPINSTDAANKRYVDDAISTSAISGTTSSTLGKIQLSGDLAGVGSTAINPKVGSVGGSTASLINSAEVLANAAVSTNTANQIVKRDVIGNFSAGTIFANLTGNVTGDVTGNISGTSRNVTGIVNVVNGGTGTSTLTGYLKGNGMTAFSASSTIPASDITGLIKKVNGSIPDADGNVAISFGTVSTGSLTNRPVSAGTNGNIYVVSGDATTAENGRTFISDGTSWKEVTSNQSATDARYLKLAGGTMAGNIVIPTTNKITITDAPVSSSDAVNKAYVDASSASASVADATMTSLGKIQLSGDLAGSGTSATNPKISSVGGSTAALINAAEIATNAATYSNTANQIVKRDGSGNFSAGNITANIIGNVSGNAGNVSGIVAGANGGTGVVNSGKTITIGGNFETIHALKFTTTAPTTLTLPSSGTLATVQQLDAKELLSNKSSDVNLGTSNDKFPTQNAVKSYVDSKDANLISTSIITGSLKVTGGTPATGKVLTSDGLGNAVWAAPAAPSATQHTIGEVFGGGIVVYVTPNGLHGLIAETIDQSAGSNWFNAVNRMSIPDLHSTEGKNYTDWRLPTKNEMNLVFLQRNITGLAGTFVVPGEYWTSESSNDNAYYFYFSTDQYAGGGGGTFEGSGPQASKTTTVGKYCRAVRSF